MPDMNWGGPSYEIAVGIAVAMYLYATVVLRSRYCQNHNLLNGKYKPLPDKQLQSVHSNRQSSGIRCACQAVIGPLSDR